MPAVILTPCHAWMLYLKARANEQQCLIKTRQLPLCMISTCMHMRSGTDAALSAVSKRSATSWHASQSFGRGQACARFCLQFQGICLTQATRE